MSSNLTKHKPRSTRQTSASSCGSSSRRTWCAAGASSASPSSRRRCTLFILYSLKHWSLFCCNDFIFDTAQLKFHSSLDGLPDLHARIRRLSRRRQLQVPQHRRASPEASYPQLQARIPPQRQDALRIKHKVHRAPYQPTGKWCIKDAWKFIEKVTKKPAYE